MSSKQFDVILMNPPYQQSSKDGIGRNKLLWPLFVEKAIVLCKDDGYIANIHPSIWRKPWSKLYSILIAYDIQILKMHSKKAAKQIFGANTRFDYYILKKAKYQKSTAINDEEGNVAVLDISGLPFLPSANIFGVLDLIDSTGRNRLNVLYCTYYHTKYKSLVKDKKSDTHKYPLLHSVVKDGPVFMYASTTERGLFGVKNKVILNVGEHIRPLLDLEGEYGMTEGAFAIVCDSREEAEAIFKAVGSEKFSREVVKATKWSNYKVEYAMFHYFKKDFWKKFV
jgi:hypothetical protein